MTDPTIDKAALEAAIKAYDEQSAHSVNWGALRAAIRAYLAALPPTTDGVRVTTVRELTWHPIMPGSTSSVADASFGEYTVEHYTEAATGDGWLAIYEDNRKLGYFGTEAAAKSACAEDRTARVMSSLNISEVEPVAWVVLLNYGEGRWSGEMLTDVLPKDSTQYKIVRPLYASPTTSPHAPEGVRDDVLDRDELLAITEHLLMLADIDDPDPAEPDCTDLCGTRVCDQLGCVVSKWRRART